jgi:hypothetical protein
MGNDGYLYLITTNKPGVSYNVFWTTNPAIHPNPPKSAGGSGGETGWQILNDVLIALLDYGFQDGGGE